MKGKVLQTGGSKSRRKPGKGRLDTTGKNKRKKPLCNQILKGLVKQPPKSLGRTAGIDQAVQAGRRKSQKGRTPTGKGLRWNTQKEKEAGGNGAIAGAGESTSVVKRSQGTSDHRRQAQKRESIRRGVTEIRTDPKAKIHVEKSWGRYNPRGRTDPIRKKNPRYDEVHTGFRGILRRVPKRPKSSSIFAAGKKSGLLL